MPKLAVFTSSFKRPKHLAMLLNNLLCQKFTDFKIYLGIQAESDANVPEVKQAIHSLRYKGIDVKMVFVPLREGSFVATKNRV